jgi:hypothetical protein
MKWVNAAPAIPRLELETRVVAQPTDTFTTRSPAGTVDYTLFVVRGVGAGRIRERTGFVPFTTERGFVTFPDLEQSPPRAGQRYALLVEPGSLRPLYPAPDEPGFEFLFPGPGGLRVLPMPLHPAPGYLFPRHVAVVRGLVRLGGAPAADVVVSVGNDRALSDEAGRFSLGVRLDIGTLQQLTVRADDRLGHGGATTQIVPDIFQHSVRIDIF